MPVTNIYEFTMLHELNLAMHPEFGLLNKQYLSLFFSAGRIDFVFFKFKVMFMAIVGHTTKRIIFYHLANEFIKVLASSLKI